MSTGDISLQPPADGITSLAFSPDSARLLVASWDATIQLHQLGPTHQPPQILPHPAAVLAVTFGSSASVAFSGGLDKRVRQWDLSTGQCRVLGKHDDAVSCMVWCDDFNLLISASWDGTLKVWDPSAPEGQAERLAQKLIAKPHLLSYARTTQRLLVSMAKRHVWVYSLPDLAAAAPGSDAIVEPSRRESALKLLTGSVACMADGKGWASGSLEGRIAVEYFDESPEVQAAKYAFRAHRQAVDGVDHAYPIGALAYHPLHNTFASGGSDGFISVWDHQTKKRMKAYPKYPTSIAALAFSPDGSRLAIGCSNLYDNALVNASPEDAARVLVLIKETVNEDCKPKVKA